MAQPGLPPPGSLTRHHAPLGLLPEALKTGRGPADTRGVTPSLVPVVAAWAVPTALGLLAVALSAYLVWSVRRRRLAEVLDLEEVPDEVPPGLEDREVRVLKRQVDVLTRTLAEWDAERRVLPESLPGTLPQPQTQPGHPVPAQASVVRVDAPPAPPAAAPSSDTSPVPPPRSAPDTGQVQPWSPPTPAPTGLPVGSSPAYVALSRELAQEGDATGAVLAQWVADLQVLRPALGAHGADLARAVADVRVEDPVAALRACREEALGLVRTAGSVRALLAPLDHLSDLGDLAGPAAVADLADEPEGAGAATLPPALVELLPAAQRERLAEAGLAG